MNIGVLKGALVYELPHPQKKTNMQYSAQTHTPDNAPRGNTENDWTSATRKKKIGKKKERKKRKKRPSSPFPTFTPSRFRSINPPRLLFSYACAHDLYRDKLQGLSVNRQKRTVFYSLGLLSSLHHLFFMLFYEFSALLDQKANNKHSVY